MSDFVSLDHSPDPSVFDIDTGYDTSSFDTPFSTVDGGGGIVDSFGTDAIPIDLDGDGNPEVVITHPGTSAEGLYFPPEHSGSPIDGGSFESNVVDPFLDWTHDTGTLDPSTDLVHGEPGQDVQWDQTQTENGFCVPTSIAMVASEFAGHEIDAQTAVDEAEQLGYLTQDSSGNWSGLDINQGQDLLEHLGVPCHVENGTIDTLRQYLDEGKAIVLGINSNDIWNPNSPEAQSGTGTIDHAVVITGIDDTTGTVTLNDPGTPDGAGEQVTLADLENAWDDGNNEMIVSDGTPAAHDGSAWNGFAMLPVVLPDPSMTTPSTTDFSMPSL